MPTLILHLNAMPVSAAPAAAGAAAWEYDYVLQQDDLQTSTHGRAVAALLPGAARGTGVVLVLPARAVSWHLLALPAKVVSTVLSPRSEPQRVRAVLGGAMEEHLLDDVADLHMAAFAGPSGDASVWVAVCARAGLQAALAALEAAGHPVSRIVAQAEPADAGSAFAQFSQAADSVQLALGTASGVAVMPLGAAAVALLQAESGVEVVAEPAVMGAVEQALGVPVGAQTLQQALLRAAQSRRSLAQLEFSPSRSGRALKRLGTAWQTLRHAPQWRPVRWGLVALLLTQIVALNAAAYRQQTLLAQKRAAIESVLTQTFPNVPLIVNAPVQMQREVGALALSRGAADADPARLLTAVASATGNAKVLTGIDLSGGTLRLKAAAWSEAEASAVNAALAAQGWSASVQGDAMLLQRKETH